MSDLDVRQVVIDHRTGEEVNPSDTERVADILDDARSLRYKLGRVIAAAEAALLAAMDERAEWTLRIPGYKLVGDSPEAADVEWDLDTLRQLEALLPSDRYAACVRLEVTEKPITAELRRVAKRGGEIAEIIAKAEHRKPKRRRVTVSRKTT